MNYRKIDNYLAFLFLGISAILLFSVSIFSSAHYEGSESIYHYFHSAAILDHPEVALNHWGKPLFIALSAPFTYFGEKGVMIFNSLVMLLSAFFAFKVGRKLHFKFSFPIVIFVLFSPVYYKFAQSCLTEPLFGLVAILSAYLFLIEKYLWSTVLISFIIYSRSEGMLFLPIYAFALIIRKQFKVLPFLLFGFLFYSFVGLFIGKGFLWYYYDYPYKAVVENYGKGPFWHWFTNQKDITGTPFSIYISISFAVLVVSALVRYKHIFQNQNLVLYSLIVAPASIYIFGHSYLWYKGLSASIGLYRIVGGVIPLLAIIAMFGIDKLIKLLSFNTKGSYSALALSLILCFLMVNFTFQGKKSIILEQPNEMEKTVLRSIDWIKENGFSDRKMFVFQAHYALHFGGDHFDKYNTNIVPGVDNREHPHDQLDVPDLLIYDSKFTPMEGGLPIENIDTTYMKSRQIFYPENEFEVYGGGKYFIEIFERVH
ncbi:MAG: hypothetical protein ABF242_07395 [Flavobacteriales bacterium]